MIFFFVLLIVIGKILDHFIEQVAQTEHVGRGNGEGIAQTERIEVINGVVHALMIDFIDDQNDRLVAFAQHGGDILVVCRQSGASVGKKENDVTGVDGDFRLTAHLLEQDVVRARLDSAGIDEREFVVEPFTVCVNAVTGDTGRILYDGDTASRDFVEKGRFADVRATDDRNKGLCHGDYSSVPRRA